MRIVLSVFSSTLAALACAGRAFAEEEGDADWIDGLTAAQAETLVTNLDDAIETAAFFAASLSLLAVLVVWALVQRSRIWAGYAGLVIYALLWIGLHEQWISGLYWSGVIVGASGLSGLAYGFVLASLAVAYRAEAPVSVVALLGAGCAGLAALGAVQQGAHLSYALVAMALSLLAHGWPRGRWLWLRRTPLTAVSLGLFALGAAVWMIIVTGELTEEVDIIFINRVFLAALVAGFIALFLRRSWILLAERDAAVRKSVEDAQREARTAEALLATEQRYTAARDLARARQMRLATASHDIRQPITALRSTMAAALQGQPEGVQKQMRAAFDYLDGLAGSYMREAPAGSDDLHDADLLGHGEEAPPREPVDVLMLTETLDRMFRGDAEGKGLDFDLQAEAAELVLDPLAAMRVLSNLLSNAIRHTQSGFVRLHGYGSGGSYCCDVSNSAALPEGMTLDDLMDPYVKGDGSAGTGLGLTIAGTLAAQSGAQLQIVEGQEGTTTFRLTLTRGGR